MIKICFITDFKFKRFNDNYLSFLYDIRITQKLIGNQLLNQPIRKIFYYYLYLKIGITIFCLILYTSALSCVSNVKYYDIYATQNETSEWDMNTIFFTGENLKFNITQESNFFEVLSPLHQLGQSKNAFALKIISLKAQQIIEKGAWTNVFAALGKNQTHIQVLYSKDGVLNQFQSPNFNESIKIRELTDNFTCFDLDFITETKVAIDCTYFDQDQPQTPINGLIIVDLEDQKYFGIEFIENIQDYNNTQYRILQFTNYKFENHEDYHLLFRSEPAWATQKALQQFILEKDSKIYTFKIINKNTQVIKNPVSVLNTAVLAKLLGIDEGKFTFSLVDFKIEANGQVYVLDANNGVYVLQFPNAALEWKLDQHIVIPYPQPYLGFDIYNSFNKDGIKIRKLVIVFRNTLILYENGVQSFVLQIPNIDWYNSFQIKLSQKYIILKIGKTIQIYNIENGKKIFTQEEDLDIIIQNPNYEDIIGINSQISKRFFLNNGLLRLNRLYQVSSMNYFVTLTAETIEQQSKRCSVTLNLRILKKNENQIIELSGSPLNPIIIIPSDPLCLNQIVSGPNLQYTALDSIENDLKDKISYTIKQVTQLSIENIHMPDPKNVVYSDILVNQNQGEFYLLFQVPSKIISMYSCQHKQQNLEITECQNYFTFSLSSIIDQNVGFFSWFIINSEQILIHQDSQFSINLYSLRNGTLILMNIIVFDSTDILNQISSVAVIKDNIYVVQSGIERVSIFQFSFPNRLIYIIDQKTIQKFYTQEIFTPIKVFENKKNNLIFIQTQTSLLIGTLSTIYSPSFVLHQVIPIMAGSQIGIAIGINTFVVIQALRSEDRIEEYNYQHLQNIYKLKDLPLFNYKLQKPLTADFSFQKGWLYIRATDMQQTFILVYQPNVLSHISLNKVIETKVLIKDGQDFNLAVDGEDEMFLYYNNQTHHQFVSILSKALFYFTPTPDQLEYVTNQIIAIKISGFSGVQTFNIQSLVTLLNTQSQLFIQQSLFDSKKKVFKFVKQSGIQYISMGTDWYSGQVTSFDIKCSKCVGSINIIPNIYRASDGNYYNDVSDGASFGFGGQVYQTQNALMFESIDGKLKQRILMNLKNEICYHVSISADSTFILSAFQNITQEVGLFIHKCKYYESCSQFRQGIQILKGLDYITKTYMPDQKNIIILNSDPNKFTAFINSIVVASLDDDGTKFTISNKYIINYQYVGSNQLLIGDFDVIKYQINSNLFATILFTDINNGIYFTHFTYNDQGLLLKTTYELFKLINFYDDQFFINSDTKFYKLKVISQQLNGSILQLNVLISTNNQAQYVLAFDLDASRPQYGLPIKKSSTSLLYVLTPYGNWLAMNKIAYIDGNVAIPYTNGEKVVIGIYPLPSDRSSFVKVIPFTHPIFADYHLSTNKDFFMIFNRDIGSNYPYLFVNINFSLIYNQYLVDFYKMRSDPQICLMDSINYQNELVIDLYLNNDFNQIQGQAILQSKSSITETNNVAQNNKFLD